MDAAEELLDEIDEILDVDEEEPQLVSLSDLMRLGLKEHDQAFGTLKDVHTGDTCALGAAIDGAKTAGLL